MLVLYLLNHPDAVPESNPTVANIGGVILLGITVVTAGAFVRDELATVSSDPLSVSGFVVAFAAALSMAMLALAGKYAVSVRQ